MENNNSKFDKFINDNIGYLHIICIFIVIFLAYIVEKKGDKNNILIRWQKQQTSNIK